MLVFIKRYAPNSIVSGLMMSVTLVIMQVIGQAWLFLGKTASSLYYNGPLTTNSHHVQLVKVAVFMFYYFFSRNFQRDITLEK